MKINEVRISGLFGTFSHSIPLTHGERVTIIHGPNGFGKTVMLQMIAALISGQTEIFERIPFEEFQAIFDDGSIATIRHCNEATVTEGKLPSKLEIIIIDKHGTRRSISAEQVKPEVPGKVLDALDRHLPASLNRSGSGWRDRTGRILSLGEVLQKHPDSRAYLPPQYRSNPFSPIVDGMNVFFVETKRLDAEKQARRVEVFSNELIFSTRSPFEAEDSPDQQRYTLRVDQYSKDIIQRIKSALADYAKHSQESDRTFPERLVRFVRDGGQAFPEKQILQRMSELETKRQRLISLGFLDSESGLRDLAEDEVKRAAEALTIYVNDVQQKLAVFDELANRVGRLMDIVNERFKYKTLTLNRDQGFRLQTLAGEPIKLEDLSSGEQHQLVVLYELLFRAPRNGLVLVDEPEISLHVAWQARFLPDLMEILALTDSYGVVATHSPVIIGTRWDLTTELTGPKRIAESTK